MKPRRALLIGLAISLVLHGSLAAALRASGAEEPPPETDESAIAVEFELPPPPEAETPIDDRLDPQPAPEAEDVEPGSTAAGTLEDPPPAQEPEPIAAMPADAGVGDAGTAIAGGFDAGVGDAGTAIAGGFDAGVGDAGTAIAGGFDAGAAEAVAAAPAPLPIDPSGPPGATGRPPGPIATDPAAAATTRGEPEPDEPRTPGTHANLLAYMPEGEVLTLILRMDRLRGTEWTERAEAIFQPMPDYRTIIGERDTTLAELFDILVISTFEPTDVTATTLAVQSDLPASRIRSFVDHRDAPVRWTAAHGGALGQRRPSKLVPAGDRRVFLMPYPEWVVLTRSVNLGALARPTTGDLDTARAHPDELPTWLERLQEIERETGEDEGPFLVLTAADLQIPADAPYVGDLPSPERTTLALQLTRGGFFVRGTLVFASEERARRFVEVARDTRNEVTSALLSRKLLQRFRAFNAVHGISFARRGPKVGYATSIDIADGRAMMEYAATWAERFFDPERRRKTRAQETDEPSDP